MVSPIEVPAESVNKDNPIEINAESKSSEEQTGIDETDSEWTLSRANRVGPIWGFEGQQHGNEDVVDWESGDVYAPDGEILDSENPSENPSPELKPVPEPVAPADLKLEEEFEESEPEEEPEPVPEPMESKPEEESGNEEEPIEINSDTESESLGFDSDWAP
ncbi:uncharacterized protein LOC130137072 [Syzygium oleosum]|uniref:uncharacterized protein LOC130137072 n=1 Tax=Syzygium oleosum TaxID=219896 RepID=UPI0024BB354A|nr:uncharacterized protein LOC130137072 [Syzygium oleosum]